MQAAAGQASTEAGRELPPAVVIAGPTASGKSALALAIARAQPATLINADALQVYRELSLLSARPKAAEMAEVPHRLYGVLSARERCSAGRWRALALEAMEEARAAGRLPILVGGSGFYLKALTEGLAAVPPVPAEIKAEGAALLEREGLPGLRAALARLDPEAAARLSPGDRQRLLRAWEVARSSGRPLAAWQAAGQSPAPFRFLWIVLLPPRNETRAAIADRFKVMLMAGALEEVRALLDLELDPALPAMKAVGVPELAAHLAGDLDLASAERRAVEASSRYAKRQETWLRGQVLRQKNPIVVVSSQFSERMTGEIFPFIRRFLLTPALPPV